MATVRLFARRLPSIVSKVRATGGDASSRGVAAVAMFELAYGRAPNNAEMAQLSGLFPAGYLDSVAELHRLLASFESDAVGRQIRAGEPAPACPRRVRAVA